LITGTVLVLGALTFFPVRGGRLPNITPHSSSIDYTGQNWFFFEPAFYVPFRAGVNPGPGGGIAGASFLQIPLHLQLQ
jgi:hypothetical protein